MPPKSSLRVAVAAACLLIALGALAGTSAGSGSSPRATAPRLLAHDTSSFASHARPAKPGPQLLHSPHKKPAAKKTRLGFTVHNDLAVTKASVLNPSGDIGKTQFLAGRNGHYTVYSRTWVAIGGPSLASVTNASFWSGFTGPDAAGLCATNPQGEPSVAYDWAAERWVVSEAAYALDGSANAVGPYVQCVAVSTSDDATGTWNRYAFQISTTLYPDHPTIGVWSDGYYLSFNQHTSNATWAGAGALALERSKMLAGASAQARYFDLENVTPGLGGLLPANLSGPNSPTAGAPELYLQAHDDPVNVHDRLEIWGFHVDWTAPLTGSTFQPAVNIPLDTGGFGYSSTFSCPQPNTTTFWTACLTGSPTSGPALPLDPLAAVHRDASDTLPQLGGRLQWGRSSGGNETLTATATENMGSNLARPAWFKLTNIGGAGWGIGARGIYNPGDSTHRYLPSAAFDNSGEVGLTFVKTDALTLLTGAYTNASDSLFGENDMDAGTVPFTDSSTFGGGTSLSLDPVDLCTFWYMGPLPENTGISYSIYNFSFPGCTPSATQPPLLTADPSWTASLVREGLSITGNVATFSGGTSTTYQWRRCDSRGLNCIDIPGANATNYTMTAVDAAGDRTLRFAQTSTNANGSSTAISHDTTIVQSIPPVNNVRPVISGIAQDGQTLTTTNGTWTSSSPLSYTYRWRRCTSGVCANISGANSSTYILTPSDVGSTVDVVVSATNTGGGTDANAVETATIDAAPVSSGGGSGSSGGGSGGGGGGSGPPDLAVSGFASSLSPTVGDNVTFVVTVTDKNATPAENLLVNVTLGGGLQYLTSTSDRGSGCSVTGASTLQCSLDWLSNDAKVGNLQITAKVIAAGQQTLTATASAKQGDIDNSNNTLALSLNTGTSGTSGGTVPVGLNGGGNPTKKQDKKKPTAQALFTSGKRGTVAKLRFKIYDDQGVAKALTTIKRGASVVTTTSTGYGPVAFGSVYYIGWHVPKKAAKGNYRFCVAAVDRAGNKSAQSCAPLALK